MPHFLRTLRAIALILIMVPCAPRARAAEQTLDLVKQRGKLECGVSPIAPGFSYLDDQGTRQGFDVDLCRAIAAAILGKPDKVEFALLESNLKFEALRSGRVDLLSAQTTWTFTRDRDFGFDFGPIVFHDSQAIMVRLNLGVKTAQELSGATVCLLPSSTSQQNLEDYFRTHALKYQAVLFENSDEWRNAFFAGRCDAISSDRSAILSVRIMASDPSQYVVLPESISDEPLAPVVRQNDSNWKDLVSWVIYALLMAEKKGITAQNAESLRNSPDPEIRRLLGSDDQFGKMLSLPNDWALSAIKAVGNYGEMFDRHFGPASSMPLERGLNRLWVNGGIMYAPPFR